MILAAVLSEVWTAYLTGVVIVGLIALIFWRLWRD